MTRSVQVGATIIDSFSAIDFDGYSKVTGLSTFTISVWRDSVEVAIPVTISEIGTSGEYKIVLSSSVVGFLKVQILVDYNKDIWEWEYDVGTGSMSGIYAMIQRVLGLTQENVFIDNTVYDSDGQLINSRVRIFDSKANCDAATDGGTETTGLIATYEQTTAWEALNQFRIYKQTRGL